MNENPETPCILGYSAIIRRLSSVGDRLPFSHNHIKVSAVGQKMTFKNNISFKIHQRTKLHQKHVLKILMIF